MENTHHQSAPTAEESINLRHYWHVVLERRWLVITAFISVFVLSVLYLMKATPIYQATVRLEIKKETPGFMDMSAGQISIDARDQDYLQTQYKNLASRTLIQKVINKLELKKDRRYSKELDVVEAVYRDLTIAPIRLSRLVDIKFEHPDPKTSASVANTLVDMFLDDNINQKKVRAWDAVQWLRNEADTLEKDVQRDALAVHKFKVEKQMVSLDETHNIVLQGLMKAKVDFEQARKDANDASQGAAKVKQLVGEGTDLDAIPFVADEILIKELKRDLINNQTDLQSLLERYKNKHPTIIQLRKKITSLDEQIRLEAQAVVESLYDKADIARDKELLAHQNLKDKERELYELGEMKVEYETLVRKAEQSRLLYDVVLGKMKEMDLSSKDTMQNLRVVDAATEPYEPIKPRIVLTLMLGVLGGLGVGFGLAFFVNYLDDSIKSQDDVETYLRLNFLGYIPNIKTNSLVERDLQAHLHPQSNAAEGFRTVRAAISLVHRGDKVRVTAVTSTIPSEGKSLVASNLAIVTAQTGLRTLLVDADLRRPSVHKAFQLQSPIGLSSYLTEKVHSTDEFVHTTDIPNLDVVCCGAVPSSPSELIGSRKMIQFLDEVRKKYDRVILDCPPVSAVSDPLVIASVSDGALFVTKFNKIRRDHARRTIQRIQDAGVHILGVVLNDIDFEGKDSYYYSYYYYQNRYYASHYKSEKGGANHPAPGAEKAPVKKT